MRLTLTGEERPPEYQRMLADAAAGAFEAL